MKKFLTLCAFSLYGFAAYATIGDTAVLNGITYKVVSDTQAEVSKIDTSISGAVVVPEQVEINGASYTVSAIGTQAFYWSKATSLELPNTVTEIKRQGVYSCSNLVSVKLGTGLKVIGDYGFGSATSLTAIEFPEGLESIGGNAFFGCKSLSDVTFPSTLKSIGSSCFYKCAMTKAILPDALEDLGEKAFLYCANLKEVKLPSGLKAIKTGAFYGTAMTEIALPETLTSIGEEAFYNAPLESINIGANVAEIGGCAFSGTKITEFNVSSANNNFTTIDGILYTKDKTILTAFPSKGTATELVLPAECVGISNGAFDRTGIKKVTLGNKFRAIDGFAFCKSQLAEINLPESLVYIGEQAFAGTNLTQVVLPSNLPLLQEAVFADCASLTSVTIPAAVTYVALRVFYNCSSLATVNCLGINPPQLENWYEAYESPFYKVPSTVKCNVPARSAAAYKNSDWSSVFSTFNETLPGAVMPASVTPQSGSSISSFDGLYFNFDTDVKVVKSNPDIQVIEGKLVAGVPVGNKVSVDSWYLTADNKNKLHLWPGDYDGYIAPFNMEAGKQYYVTVPAGIFQNEAGDLNQVMILNYAGEYVAPKVEVLSVTPADGAKIKEIATLEFTFAEKVNLQTSKLSSIKVMKNNTEEIPVEQWWALEGKTSGTSLAIFAGDEYDGFSMPISLDANADYYVILPAALFRLASTYSAASEEIVLHYVSETSGIEIITVDDANEPAEYYNLNGVRVENPTNGIYIKRQGAKTTKVYVK